MGLLKFLTIPSACSSYDVEHLHAIHVIFIQGFRQSIIGIPPKIVNIEITSGDKDAILESLKSLVQETQVNNGEQGCQPCQLKIPRPVYSVTQVHLRTNMQSF